MRDLFAVMFVLGLLVALAALSRSQRAGIRPRLFKIEKGGNSARLALLERLPLTPANSLHLVRADSHTFLLAVHSAGVVVLSEWHTSAEGCPEVRPLAKGANR